MYRVLIAEDEQIEREMLMQIVSAHFPTIDQIIPAENGQQAVDLFDQYQPDLILMDINMPLKSGMEALREIRQIAKKAFVCIILTSYNAMLRTAFACMWTIISSSRRKTHRSSLRSLPGSRSCSRSGTCMPLFVSC